MSNIKQIAPTLQKIALSQFEATFGEAAATRLKQEITFVLELVQESKALADAGRFNTGLHLADPKAIGRRLCELAILGLSYNPALKQAYLVSFKGQVANMISYKGEIDFLQKNGIITRADCKAINENDAFNWEEVNGGISYRYRPSLNPGKIIGAFCVYHLTGGGLHGRVITMADIQKRKNVAKSGKFWSAWEKEMILKTAARMARHGLPGGKAAEALGRLEAANNSLAQIEAPAAPEEVDPERLEELKAKAMEIETPGEINTFFKTLPAAERSAPEIRKIFNNAKKILKNEQANTK
jgi:phage RecT family recombinase